MAPFKTKLQSASQDKMGNGMKQHKEYWQQMEIRARNKEN